MMENDEERKNPKMIGVKVLASLVVVIAAPIAFLGTCNTVTEVALRIAKPDARGETYNASYILYGLFLGIPLGLVVTSFVVWFVHRRAEKAILKFREKK